MTPYTPPSNATSLSGYTGGAVPVVAPALFDADADIQRGTFGAVRPPPSHLSSRRALRTVPRSHNAPLPPRARRRLTPRAGQARH